MLNYSEFTSIFKALSDEKRLKIIDMLSYGSLSACKILEKFNFSQPALSQHMKVLVDCGLVSSERRGNWIHYSLIKEKYVDIIQFVQYLSSGEKDCICAEGYDKCR